MNPLHEQVLIRVESPKDLPKKITKTPKWSKASQPKKTPTVLPDPTSGQSSGFDVHLSRIELLNKMVLAHAPAAIALGNPSILYHGALLYADVLVGGAISPNHLTLSSASKHFQRHHRAHLSECLGVGCGLVAAEAWLRKKLNGLRQHGYAFADFESLSNSTQIASTGGTRVQLDRGNHYPDFVLVAEDSAALHLELVECKGTSVSKATAVGQLATATLQLEAVKVSGLGTSVYPHAFSTRFSKAGGVVEVLGVDPEPDEPKHRERGDDPSVWLEVDKRELRILNPSRMHEMVKLESARLSALWSGIGAKRKRGLRLGSNAGDVIGHSVRSRIAGIGDVEFFFGALSQVAEAGMSSDPERAASALAAVPVESSDNEEPATRNRIGRAALELEGFEAESATALDYDGRVLSVRRT